TTSPADMAKIYEISMLCYEGIVKTRSAQAEIRKLRDQLRVLKEKAGQGTTAEAIAALDQKAAGVEGAGGLGLRGGGGSGLARLAGDLLSVMNLVPGT